MYVESRQSGKKSWQTGRERVSVLADLALRKETVVRKLIELREAHDLTQERAAGQVGVTVRQWQRWESGASVPYARNISAIAGHFGINEGEFFDPPEERQATTQPPASQDERMAAMEARLMEQASVIRDLLDQQNALLARQSEILERIERAVELEDEAARRLVDADEEFVGRVAQLAAEAFQPEPRTPGRARRKPAKQRTPRA